VGASRSLLELRPPGSELARSRAGTVACLAARLNVS
jgi:hypothetical protein